MRRRSIRPDTTTFPGPSSDELCGRWLSVQSKACVLYRYPSAHPWASASNGSHHATRRARRSSVGATHVAFSASSQSAQSAR